MEFSKEQLNQYQKNGFVVWKGFWTTEEVEATKQEIERIIDNWYEEFERTGKEGLDWEDLVNRDPKVKTGEIVPMNRVASVRRLFRMAVRTDYFRRMACHPKNVSVAKQILGPDVKLLQSMALLKPPGSMGKCWHQDNGYFRLTPNHMMGFWIALDEVDVENGCMHLLPGSHLAGVAEHDSPGGNHMYYGLVDIPPEEQVVPVPMSPGDTLIFHCELKHFTPPNKTKDKMRQAIQYHYGSSKCKPTVCPKPSDAGYMERDRDLGPGHFDCAPCVEPKFWYYRKAELLVAGKDYGGDYI